MKINCNNKDLKITNRHCVYGCHLCVFNFYNNFIWCSRFCRSGKAWIKDICNSGIFRV